MSKELKNITESVMNKIHQDDIKMKPKIYFILGSVLTFVGLISAFVASTLLFGLVRFFLRTNYGWRAHARLSQMLESFPWWIVMLAVIGLVLGVWLIRKYDFSYKMKSWVMIAGFVLAVIISGIVIDSMGLNNILLNHGPMRGVMNNLERGSGLRLGPWMRR